MDERRRTDAAVGCLMGMAVGDALGLPYERISRARQHRNWPDLKGHRFFLGRGMVSDDTEHACMTAQAVIASGGDPERFIRSLAWRLRFWLLGLPAGIGSATLRSIEKLWLGFSWRHSGVFSAGNGPSMRSPVLGVLFNDDWSRCQELVFRSTWITHTDPVALHCALAVAVASGMAARPDADLSPGAYLAELRGAIPELGHAIQDALNKVASSVENGEDTGAFAASLGLVYGASGYSLHSVPVALHAWLSNPRDYATAVMAAIRCGGDTDTTAAITGGIVGAAVGKGGIPGPWMDGLFEWPCGLTWMERLAERSAGVAESQVPGRPLAFNVPGQLFRNSFFMAVVIFHGFRRMLPPY